MTRRRVTNSLALVTPQAAPGHEPLQSSFAIAVLTLSFLLSYLQYCLQRVDLVRLLPVTTLIAGAFLYLMLASTGTRRQALAAMLGPANLAIVGLASLPPLFSSFYRQNIYPAEYGMVMIATLLAARALLSGAGLAGLLRAFFYATSAGLLLVVGLTVGDLLAAFGEARYYPLNFEPNRIAFFAVTAIPPQLWFATCRPHRRYILGLSAICLTVTLAASSRGSSAALLIGALATAILFAGRTGPRFARMPRTALMAGLMLAAALTLVPVARPQAANHAAAYLWTKLALDSRARGMDSGLTGRTNGWSELIEVLPKTCWLTGNGYRTTDEDFDFSVDSGYLASVYELGALSTSIILLKFATVIVGFAVAFVRGAPGSGVAGALFFTLAVFFANGVVHRVLFGYGDPASILALFCFISQKHDLLALPSPGLHGLCATAPLSGLSA